MVSWIYSDTRILSGVTTTGQNGRLSFRCKNESWNFLDLKKFQEFFENAQTFFCTLTILEKIGQTVLPDEISTLVHFFWIRVTGTVLPGIRPFCPVVVTPERMWPNEESE